ncbi:MAG: hypothetical protein IVW55_12245 [Chloroflexi bacterium]|nr:hypothetical protein [Chloroflexota bacterium]
MSDDTDTATDHDRLTAALRSCLEPLLASVDAMVASITAMHQTMRHIGDQYDPPLLRVIRLDAVTPVTLSLQGRRHNALFLPANTTVTLTVPGLAPVTLNLLAGWNTLELPDGTMVTTATAVSALYRVANTRIGDAI